ncbi:hypothetical protein PPERSA_06642 [Pseudocohnilembus persalinus]|uniref:Uncharacterized protein n=1 Tax=Pseudocohnilembus persalinus TaxID=266149 RepID=A0A0V0QSK8_PSEPJ|nr:hypothetical protein PPERSA_06642 [Pseudocohnilembus persalinus]|eukprot:KRX05008.1 hypothetical protein PPERSA_06642 [Pseudocohnilembus persalinus]
MDQSSTANPRLSDDFNEIEKREYNMYLKRQEILKKQQQQHMKDMKNAINLNNSSKLNQSKKSKTSINMASSILQLDPDDKNIVSQLVINDEQRTQKTTELRQQEREQKLRAKIEEKKQKLKNERELQKLRNKKQFEIKNPDNNVILNSSIKKNYNDNLKNSAISIKSVRFQNINKSEQIIEELSEFESQITENELKELQNQFTSSSKKKKKKKKKEKPEKIKPSNINLDMISPNERYRQIRPTLLMGVSDKDMLFQNIQKRLENEEENQENEYDDDSDESSIKTQDISSVELTSESEYEEEEDIMKQKDFKQWQQYQKEKQNIKEKQNSEYEDELQQAKSLSQKNKERIELIQSISNKKVNRPQEIQQQQLYKQKFNLNENLSIPQKDTFFLRSTEKLFQIQEDEIKQKYDLSQFGCKL